MSTTAGGQNPATGGEGNGTVHGATDHGGHGAVGHGQVDHGGHGNGHDHLHPPHEQGKAWRTVAILVSAGLILTVIVGLWHFFAGQSERIRDLETQVKSLSENRAEKGDMKQVQDKVTELAENRAEKSELKHLEDKVEELSRNTPEATPVSNELNRTRLEIDGLRQSTNNIFSSYNNAIGKYDSSVNAHEKQLTELRAEQALLGKAVARQEGILESNSPKDDKEVARLRDEISSLRERMAKMEALLSLQKK